MKRTCFVVTVLALVLVSTTAIAQNSKELCLAATSSTGVTSTHILSYTGLAAGHVVFYGETCYDIPPTEGAPGSEDCLPVHGSGLLFENKLEIAIQGVEYSTDFGVGIFTTGQTHFMLSLDTLTGTYASDAVNYVEGERFEHFDAGTATAVKCPAVTQDEKDADALFKKLIKQLDVL